MYEPTTAEIKTLAGILARDFPNPSQAKFMVNVALRLIADPSPAARAVIMRAVDQNPVIPEPPVDPDAA